MIEVMAIGISAIAVVFAFWQVSISKAQLEQAKNTKNETDRLLDDIKSKVQKVESISDETRKDVREQISKLIDKQDENFKTLLNAPNQSSQNEMLMSILPNLIQNPDSLDSLMKLGEKLK